MNRLAQISLMALAVALVCVTSVRSQAVAGPGFAVLPFEDHAAFDGPWDLGNDVPRYIGAYLAARYGSLVVSPQVVLSRAAERGLGTSAVDDPAFWLSLRDDLKVRFLLAGAVESFDVSRFSTGSETLGGYEAFKGEVRISFTLFDLTRLPGARGAAERSRGIVEGEHADRSFALTLFGKQSQRTIEYRELNRIKFGSDEFDATVIGQACRHLVENLAARLEEDLPSLRSRDVWTEDTTAWNSATDSSEIVFRGRIVRGSLIYLEGEDAFISLGDLDGVQKGQTVTVHSAKQPSDPKELETKVGTLEIIQVRGPHLSLARIRTGKEAIKQKLEVRARVID